MFGLGLAYVNNDCFGNQFPNKNTNSWIELRCILGYSLEIGSGIWPLASQSDMGFESARLEVSEQFFAAITERDCWFILLFSGLRR